VAQQAARTPDAVAVVFKDEALTYRELDRKSSALARELRRRGAGPDTLVAVFLERSTNVVVTLLGVLKSGAAYVPLAPDLPAERLAFMLTDSKPTVIVTERDVGGRLPEHRSTVLNLDDGALEGHDASSPPDVPNAALELAYVIYTSGSTGKPKGVQIRHQSVVNFLLSMRDSPGLDATDTLLAVTTTSFDIAALELFLPLVVGARVVIASHDVTTDGQRLAALLKTSGATVMQATPATWQLLVATGWMPDQPIKILCGGEAMPRSLADELLRHGNTLWNMYGPTETTIWSTTHHLGPGSAPVPIGRPIANTQTYVLDRHLQPVPVGVPGELYIGGAGLSAGYLHRPQLTAERFIESPFDPVRSPRIYRTGDVVRYLADGLLEHLGRTDHQVKLRGFRIELGEIEATLREQQAIAEAVVVVREDVPGDKRLVAYSVARTAAPAESELRAFLKDRLPAYMVPSTFVALEALPRTPNGKVDRAALPAPGGEESKADYVAPETRIERAIADIWRDILRVERLSLTDNFFDVGGHSLLAALVVSRVHASIGQTIALRDIFENPTLGGLARHVERLPGRRSLSHDLGVNVDELSVAITPVRRDGRLALSFAQERLLFLDQVLPSGHVYNLPMAFRLRGALDRVALELALREIVRRHEALRTTFAFVGDRPRQVIGPPTLELPVVDLTALDDTERQRVAQRLSDEDANTSFDLATGPLFRANLVRLAPDEHLFMMNMHHIVVDGWSIDILLRELTALYGAFCQGEPSPLPDLPVQFADVAAWQRRVLSEEKLEAQLGYWRKQLASMPSVLDLPTDRPRPQARTYVGARHPFAVAKDTSSRLDELSRREHVTPFMVVLAAFYVLLYRYTGQERIVVGTPIANRSRVEVEGLIGLFVETLAVAGDLSGDPTFRELLARVREASLGAFAHQDVPFERLVDDLRPERDLGHAPIFQVMLALQQQHGSRTFDLPGLRVSRECVSLDVAKLDLAVNMHRAEAGYECWIDYSTELFDADTIERLAAHLVHLFEAVVADPGAKISTLRLLGEAERRRMLVEWNTNPTDFQVHRCLHELFEEQAAHTPDAIAVVYEGSRSTYRSINARANQLARRLRAQGVGPDVLVGLSVERSTEMIIALLAILKAGGAYVPLDPEYPKDRLAFMVGDSRPALVLTETPRLGQLAECGARVGSVQKELSLAEAESTENLETNTSPDDLVYGIYTSGSTGKPKCTLNRHRGVVSQLMWNCRAYPLDASDVGLHKAAFSFDASVTEIFWPLLSGASLVLARPGGQRDMTYIADLIAAERITTAVFAPSPLAAFLGEPGVVERCRSLRRVIVGGEAVSREVQERFFSQLGADLINVYGPAEAAMISTSWRCQRGGLDRSIPIGRPVSNTQVYVLDHNQQPVPVGVVGELYIGGAQVARGYLSRPELTAEKFVRSPLPEAAGATLYRTGDLVRYRADGVLEFAGRIDHQVKIRGMRIELGEIEAVLETLQGVTHAVVIVREDDPGEKRLVGYFVASGDPAPTALELRARLEEALPQHMVPSALIALQALPLTPNGKVDRRALPKPDRDLDRGRGEFVAPRNEVERALAEIWRSILRVDRVGVTDDLFALGGDSILIMQIVWKARNAGLSLSARDFFLHTTIATLAPIATSGKLEVAEQGPVVGEVALTPIQRAFFEQRPAEPNHFNQSMLLEVSIGTDPRHLQQAVEALIRHHDALRLRFAEADHAGQSVWTQTSASPTETGEVFSRVDLTELPESTRRQELEAECAREQRGLALSGPLFRATHFTFGPGESARLLFVSHHLVIDAVSWRIVLDDLETARAQVERGEPIRLPPKSTSYKAWADKLRSLASSASVRDALEDWIGERGAPPSPLPRDRPAGSNTVASEAVVTVRFSSEETQAILQHLPKAYGTEINDALVTALGIALSRWTASSVSIAIEGHGRDASVDGVDLSRTVGWFTVFAPVLLALDDLAPERALRVVQSQLGRVRRRELTYMLLRYLAEPEVRSILAARPAPEVIFNYLGQWDQTFSAASRFRRASEDAGPARSPRAQRGHLIEINAAVSGGCLHVPFAYSEEIHDRATMERVAADFREALVTLVAQARSRPARLFPDDASAAYAVSAMQSTMLTQAVAHAGRGVYHCQNCSWLRDDAGFSATALEHALRRAIAIHPVFRTVFFVDPVSPLQAPRSAGFADITVEDLRALGATAQDERIDAIFREDLARPFDVQNQDAPLARFKVVQLSNESAALFHSIHHAINDGWGNAAFLDDVISAYESFVRGVADEPPGVPRDVLQEFIDVERAVVERGEARAFWTQRLTTCAFASGAATPRPASEAATHGARHVLARPLVEQLRGIARRTNVSLKAVCLSAALDILAPAGEPVGVVSNGRTDSLSGVFESAGLFWNIVPFHLPPPREVGSRLLRTHRELLAVEPHVSYPASNIARDMGRVELFHATFNFTNFRKGEARRRRLIVVGARSHDVYHYPLNLAFAVSPLDDSAAVEAKVDARYFDAAATRDLVDRYVLELTRLGEPR
jgi:amino acid adenylation domain-containing protein/non-ribosomal peptide synthase protein (TIGR01720 family)